MSTSPMAYRAAHLRAAEQILAHYEGAEPFPAYLKQFFQHNRKFGSKDRRQVTGYCYAFFRIGHAMPEAGIRDRILAGLLMAGETADPALADLVPEWREIIPLKREDRIAFAEVHIPGFRLRDLFPMPGELSPSVDFRPFVVSHFDQRDVFIRLRPGQGQKLIRRAEHLQIPFEKVTEHCLRLPAGVKLDELGVADKDFVVQDWSSQQTAAFLPDPGQLPAKPRIWDACAGSGGKSIMAFDYFPAAMITVSDTRKSILQNLLARFRVAGIEHFDAHCIDLANADNQSRSLRDFFGADHFNLILADVPCSGSGTWGRDPWAMLRFSEDQLRDYISTQRRIMDRISPELKAGAYLLYMTCSVYQEENEGMKLYLGQQHGLHCEKSGIIAGYEKGADTMYAALFTLPR